MSVSKFEPIDIQVDNTIETSVTISNFVERYHAAQHEGIDKNSEATIRSENISVKSAGKDDTTISIIVEFCQEVSKLNSDFAKYDNAMMISIDIWHIFHSCVLFLSGCFCQSEQRRVWYCI